MKLADQLPLILVTAFISIVGTLISQRVSAFFSKKDSQAALKLHIVALEEKQANMAAQQTKLQLENSELKEQIAKYEDRERILAEYTADPKTGVRIHKVSGDQVCAFCLVQIPPTVNPVKSIPHGSECPICGKRYETGFVTWHTSPTQ